MTGIFCIFRSYLFRDNRLYIQPMKKLFAILLLAVVGLSQCSPPATQSTNFDAVSRVESGTAVSVMLTAYSTTLVANGVDRTRLRVALTDSLSREISTATDSIRVYVTGNAFLSGSNGEDLLFRTDTSGQKYAACKLENGVFQLLLVAGTQPERIKVEARSGTLWPGAHEIHTIPKGFESMQPDPDQLPPTTKPINRMIGADISWLPQFEDQGRQFLENGVSVDAVELLKKHGFNTIRLRIFVNPENEKGYSPEIGYCGLDQTLAMARRVKDAGMDLLLDFHYSDYWADPQQQYKPQAWESLEFPILKDSVRAYTTRVLDALAKQGTPPDMVQVGNEINHGLLWPDGHISQPNQLAGLLSAGVEGVEAFSQDVPIMMHIALGGQNEEARFWLDNMLARGVRFDIIGISFYPRWHGTLEDLDHNLRDLVSTYNKPVNVVEYSDFKKTVHDVVFELPDNMGKGACIWEPLTWRSGLFGRDGSVTELMQVYDALNRTYILEE